MITKNIYFVGAHATGKTTLARWVSDHWNMPMISEGARELLAQAETTLSALRTDISAITQFQKTVLQRQIEKEAATEPPFVSDRGICCLAYTAQHTNNLHKDVLTKELGDYIDSMRRSIVFFVRPHRTLLKEDGVRESPTWDEIMQIDGMVKFLLELYNIPHIVLGTQSMAERTRTINCVLSLSTIVE